MNQYCFTGRLGKDPELRTTTGGKAVCKLRVAVDGRGGRDSDEETLWLDVTAWDATAENCERFLQTGSRVGVTGQLRPNKFTTKDGRDVETIEVSAFTVDFLTPKGEQEARPPRQQAQASAETGAPDPFGDE